MSIQNLIRRDSHVSEPLRCTMRVTQANRTFIELIREKEGFETMNAALSKIIEIARPFFSRRSSSAVKKLNKNKKSVTEFPSQQSLTDVKDVDQIEYNEPV